jgi:hypothetical protein
VHAAKRYKFQALVTFDQPADRDPGVEPPEQDHYLVVRARHRVTRRGNIFTALVSSDDPLQPGDTRTVVTLRLVGDDICDYLAPGEHFSLWRGHDIGHGIISRRLFV